MRDVFLIVIISCCALVALGRPVFGLLTFVCLGFLNPHSMTWSIGRTFPLSQLVGLSTIIGYFFWSEPKRFPRQREFAFLLALWCVFGVSTLFAIYPSDALVQFKQVSKILLMVVLSISLINTEQRLRSLFYVIALSLGFYGLKAGFFVITSGGSYIVWGPEESFLEANNAIGLALVMNLPLLVYLLKTETRTWLRWIMKAMFLLSYPAIICTYSRGAWLGMVTVTTVLVLRSQHRFRLLAAGGLLALFLLPAAIQLAPEQLVKRYNDLVNYKEESSAQSRFWV
jgi:putative inorganic carbon (HCO3(-)) transporter